MKLGAYALAATLAFMLAQNTERAQRLLDALVLFGTIYALYALILGLSGLTQENIFYETRPTSRAFAGPFVSPNNFATFMGLSMLCAVARLLDLSARTVIVGRGPRQFAVSGIHFLFGTGAVFAVAFIFTFAMLVATGSRAGFIASLAGLSAAILFAGVMAREWAARGWAVLGVCVMIASMAGLFMVTGDTLGARLDALARVGGFDQTRWLLWEASLRMIGDSPWLGLGLGTFEPAYPLYADRVMPFINDKAHNDFLEFAAGLGLPAATAWWLAMLALLWMCIRGVFVRRRNRHFAQLGIAATVLVGVHSIFDFSLQIPAVALTYALILGLAVAQSAPTRHTEFE
jgi:O-antigen ligase